MASPDQPNNSPFSFDDIDDIKELEQRFAALDSILENIDDEDDFDIDDDSDFNFDEELDFDDERTYSELFSYLGLNPLNASDELIENCYDALRFIDEDEITLAKEKATAAAEIDAEHPCPAFLLGIVADRENNLPQARKYADIALKGAPTFSETIGFRAHIHIRENEFVEAESLVRGGIAANPHDAQLFELLARITLAQGKLDAARDSIDCVLNIDPDNLNALSIKRTICSSYEQQSVRLASLRELVHLHPNDLIAVIDLAELEAIAGNIARAKALYARARRIAPQNRDAQQAISSSEKFHTDRFIHLARVFDHHPIYIGITAIIFLIYVGGASFDRGASTFSFITMWTIAAAWCITICFALIAPGISRRFAQIQLSKSVVDSESEITISVDSTESQWNRVADIIWVLSSAGRRADAVAILNSIAKTFSDSKKTLVASELQFAAERLSTRKIKLISGLTRSYLTIPILATISFLSTAVLIVSLVQESQNLTQVVFTPLSNTMLALVCISTVSIALLTVLRDVFNKHIQTTCNVLTESLPVTFAQPDVDDPR